MLRTPASGTRDLTTKVRVWTDALKTPAVWGVFTQDDFIVKGDCRGVRGDYWPDME